MGIFNRKKDYEEKRLKEYIREYSKICQTITEDMIYMKPIILQYDELVPDMFISITVEGNELVEEVLYDIYNRRLYKVLLEFTNGKKEECKIVGEIDKEIKDDFTDITWSEPLVELSFYSIQVSLFDLIKDGVKVYLLEYGLKELDVDNGEQM